MEPEREEKQQEKIVETLSEKPNRTPIFISGVMLVGILKMCITLLMYKRMPSGSSVTVTGSASVDFESDIIVWRCNYMVHGDTLEQAYEKIKKNETLVRQYLTRQEVSEDELLFGSVDISRITRPVYDENDNRIGEEEAGYDLSQSVIVSSDEIDKVEEVSRDISQLIASGVELESRAPQYYCTTLDEVKMELIEAAAANARERAELVAAQSGAKLGKLTTANLGVFQITALNTGTSGYGSTGTLDTSSRYKTAMITVKLNYSVK